jgi:truncated hemoglobin YjbI
MGRRIPSLATDDEIFYSKYVPQDPIVGPLFNRMSPDHPERVAAWLTEGFGGPDFYSKQYGGYSRMISEHVGKCITEEQRARWVQMLCQSAEDAKLPDDAEFRAAFVAYLEWGSRIGKEKFSTERVTPTQYASPKMVVGLQRYPGLQNFGLSSPRRKRDCSPGS